MNRVLSVSDQTAEPSVQSIFDMMKKKLGRVMNMFRCMANSPVTVEAFTRLSECCEKTVLGSKLRHEISLLVAEVNSCNYCVAAHSQIAKAMHLSDQDILQARRGITNDPKSQAILNFCKAVIEKRGSVSDQEVKHLKDQGVSDKELCEIVLLISFNTFTNYFNKVIDTELDFPSVPSIEQP